jgi:hypothetical protein
MNLDRRSFEHRGHWLCCEPVLLGSGAFGARATVVPLDGGREPAYTESPPFLRFVSEDAAVGWAREWCIDWVRYKDFDGG